MNTYIVYNMSNENFHIKYISKLYTNLLKEKDCKALHSIPMYYCTIMNYYNL